MGKSPLLKISVVFILASIFIFILPFVGLFAFNAQETELAKGQLYFATAAMSMFGLLGLALINKMVNDGKLDEDTWGWANVYLFEPDQSVLGDTDAEEFITFRRVLHFSIVFALLFALIGIVTQTSFTGTPIVEQQVSETGQLILSSEPSAGSETLSVALIISFLTGLSFWLIHRYNLPSATKYVLFIPITLLTMAFWLGIHLARYGSAETALTSVLIFGFLTALLTLVTGTPLTIWIVHIAVNLFGKMTKLFSSETAQIVVILLLFIYILGLVIGFVLRRSKN